MAVRAFDVVSFMERASREGASLRLPKGGNPEYGDADGHREAFAATPVLYALWSLSNECPEPLRAVILFQILRTPRGKIADADRALLDRVGRFLLTRLHPDVVLRVFLSLRRVRANHKHVKAAILRFILRHPDLRNMAQCRRPALRECLEHALGRNTARRCAALLAQGDLASPYLRRNLLRFAAKASNRLQEVVPFLFRLAPAPRKKGASYAKAHRVVKLEQEGTARRPKTVTATNRGDISATLVHWYRGGGTESLRQAIEQYTAQAAEKIPTFEGKVALILDASGSTRGFGDREYCCISQSVALAQVMSRVCPDLKLHQVGGTGEPPRPQGPTDLAGGLLEALHGDPDLAVIVSDGHENTIEGDLARVTAALPGAGVATPVAFCHSKFTEKDDLRLRTPAPGIRQMEFWHEDDFPHLLAALFAGARGESGREALRKHLLRRLEGAEREAGA